MAVYYVSKNSQETGEHEIHTLECEYMPDPWSRLHLGDFSNCRDAIEKAKLHYDNVDGCHRCSKECHTR